MVYIKIYVSAFVFVEMLFVRCGDISYRVTIWGHTSHVGTKSLSPQDKPLNIVIQACFLVMVMSQIRCIVIMIEVV